MNLNLQLVPEKELVCETTVLDFIPLSPSSMVKFSDFPQFSFLLVPLYFAKRVFFFSKACLTSSVCERFQAKVTPDSQQDCWYYRISVLQKLSSAEMPLSYSSQS